ncbi:MAG TPA: phosphoadenylylsulfate reductase [Myxococcales bacterium]|nr:phosphoadenylylsulfate reductase [Myxococcales bacterium]
MSIDLAEINRNLKAASPAEIITWALSQGSRPVVTTNFGPYEASILHACTQLKADIKVIWCDSGYNTEATYQHADQLTEALKLNLSCYVPRQSAAHRDVRFGGIPDMMDPAHERFTEQVKLEPFKRALAEHRPEVWFTNIRQSQTEFRRTLDVVSVAADGMLKVSPFFYWSDERLDGYLATHGLDNETEYFDPTKVLEHRECGLHTLELK